jgi:hypothetical protein
MADPHDETTEDDAAPEASGSGDVRPTSTALAAAGDVAVSPHTPVDRFDHEHDPPAEAPADLTDLERELLADLFAIVEEHADEVARPVDRRSVIDAFVFACEHHADQRRQSGESFIVHPVGVAKICAGHAARHRDAVRRAPARHRRGHVGLARTRSGRRSARRSAGSSTA